MYQPFFWPVVVLYTLVVATTEGWVLAALTLVVGAPIPVLVMGVYDVYVEGVVLNVEVEDVNGVVNDGVFVSVVAAVFTVVLLVVLVPKVEGVLDPVVVKRLVGSEEYNVVAVLVGFVFGNVEKFVVETGVKRLLV